MPRKGENIYKRKDGRWEGRYIKARSKTGKAVYGYVYAPTYKEAKRKRSQAIINIEANQTTICKVPETTMPTCFIRKLANDWMNSIQSQIKKSSYVKYYNILHPCPQHNAAAANSRFHHRTENPYYGYIAQKQMFYPYNSNSRQSDPAHSKGISQPSGICSCRCK